ncbi:hypothetical protein GCM10023114_22950 [Mycolicibacterium sediminis]|uniref:Uncharacterized protein n=1 Tax=Mycolicibacterium sediminis TaxID=1286180 RepID=A0A7I7QK39_9MYCO|nr:hypothetical protein MSEDJ_05560 [Mycolicibacterium sediminis]
MLTVPPIVEHTTWPSIAWSFPSMVTFEPPGSALADSDADDDSDELDSDDDSDEADDDELGDASSPDEQPDRPATSNAAPLTATSTPRFTIGLLR